MPQLGIVLMIIFPVVLMDWHAHGVFVARGYRRRYGHGKSWARASKHYKTNWTFIQRMLWIPVFKEPYERKYRRFAFLTYIHWTLALIAVICFFLDEYVFWDIHFWREPFYVTSIFFMFRYIYNDLVGTSKDKH